MLPGCSPYDHSVRFFPPVPMFRSDLPAFSRLLLEIYGHAHSTPVDRFQDAALESLKRALHFDCCNWGTATMTPVGIDVHSLHRHNFPDDMFAAFMAVKHEDSAAVRLTAQPRMTIGFAAEEEFTREDQAGIRKFARDFSQHHCLITSDINPHTHFLHWISLFRRDYAMRCTPEEITFLSEVGPHLMQALAINRLVHMDRLLGDVARDAWSVAIADQHGVLYHSDPRFLQLVRKDWSLKDGERLPARLLGELKARGKDEALVGAHSVIHSARQQDLLYLRARARHDVDSLSPREYVVAKMLTAGMTHKEIAARLARSPDTVRSQVKSVFSKLQINNVALLPPLIALRQ
jgi:DNA-binding CsgD family transcriptional regulator